MAKQLTFFVVRDLRQKEKFVVDDIYLNGYARVLGPAASMVYVALCRHANKEQEAFPSQVFLAEEIGLKERQVRNHINILKKAKIIEITRQKTLQGKWLRNTYVLLDRSQWLKPEAVECLWRNQRQKTTKTRGNPLPIKETHRKETHTTAKFKNKNEQSVNKPIPSSIKNTNWVNPFPSMVGKSSEEIRRLVQ